MFLKRFEAKGFKSFAQHTVINFDYSMTGIVGPNGSGKSNIIDGLKWVLGEKSKKELRGKESSDFIFSGSEGYEPANYAEVSLTFDNSLKLLKSDYQTLTVSRKLTRGVGKNEYFLNGEPCLLSKIKEIFVDTGLQKGSLGVISQGTVSWFIEAKPVDRRKIFEDASGIGKYTIAKAETEKKLFSTRINLTSAKSKFESVEKEVNRLKKQAEQAQIYLGLKNELKELEISVIVKDVIEWKNVLNQIEGEISQYDSINCQDKELIESLEKQIESDKNKFDDLDRVIDEDQRSLSSLQNEFNDVNTKKNMLTENLTNQLSSQNIKERVSALKTLINVNNNAIAETEKNISILKDELSVLDEIEISMKNKIDDNKRLLAVNVKVYEQKKLEYQFLLDQLAHANRYSYGTKAILDHKDYLSGVHDVLENLISVKPEYELAIVKALGPALKNIVVNSNNDAKKAIEFLKNNRAGQATLLPINDIKEGYFPDEMYQLLASVEGFVGMGNDLVDCHQKYDPIINALLGKVIISENLDSAFVHSKLTNSRYRIYTLEGDYLAVSGAISGGYNKKSSQLNTNLENDKIRLKDELDKLNVDIKQKELDTNRLIANYQDHLVKIDPKKNQLIKLEIDKKNLQDELKQNHTNLAKYDFVSNDPVNQKSQIDQLTVKVINLKKQIDDLKGRVDSSVNLKNQYKTNIGVNEQKLKTMRSNYSDKQDKVNKLINDKTRVNVLLENSIQNLANKYQMTVDYALEYHQSELNMSLAEAKERIKELTNELDKFTNINLDAAIELESKQQEYDLKLDLYNQVEKACADLEQSIKVLDQKAIEEFNRVVDQANEKLPDIFKYLFGGGTCQIVYDDPDNVLLSGIEIKTFLPGKTISNLMLYSGGEKTLIALSVLLAVLQSSSLPLVILDEAESALDLANVERFGNIILKNSNKTQFIVISHRPGTMERCHILYGVTMAKKGISSIVPLDLSEAKAYSSNDVN